MSDPQQPDQPDPDKGEAIRHHVFDGIQEYDKRLPNWWLMTLYGSIVFAVVYWLAKQHFPTSDDHTRLAAEMSRIEAAKLAASANALDDDSLWKMSQNPVFIAAGEATFKTTCASCHGPALQGGIGPSLVDATWIHGGKPTEVLHTVTDGVLVKGMPAWGPVLGPRKVSEVVAYILSKHQPQIASK